MRRSSAVGADRGSEGEPVVFFGCDEPAEGSGAGRDVFPGSRFFLVVFLGRHGKMDLVAEHIPAKVGKDMARGA